MDNSRKKRKEGCERKCDIDIYDIFVAKLIGGVSERSNQEKLSEQRGWRT